MAYSNWGGKVWCDGVARHDLCDVTVRQLFDEERYAHYLMHWTKERTEDDADIMRHAIVGDPEAGVMVSLYKDGPFYGHYQATENGPERVPVRTDDADFDWYSFNDESDEPLKITINGVEVRLWYDDDGPSTVWCEFVDKQGRMWRGCSGYCLGEGFEEWN